MVVERRHVPRLVVAGVASGVGKTTVTVALARALRTRGLRVAIFKCGPDYLDPSYHARAVGHSTHNLDGWMMGRDAVLSTFLEATHDADIALVEGVMGLFDGASPTGEAGSTAEIAKWLGAPVVLVVDAAGMARSFAAVVDGFARFDPEVRVVGAIANRVGSAGHGELLRKALRNHRFFGAFPRDDANGFPERHLGLHTADRNTLPESLFDIWGARAAESLEVEALLAAASAMERSSRRKMEKGSSETKGGGAQFARPSPRQGPRELGKESRFQETGAAGAISWSEPEGKLEPAAGRARIGVARDEAFHFYYLDNLRRLESLGAELVEFSPIHDLEPPEVDGLYFGGGYPEVYARRLSANEAMRRAVAEFAARGGPIYAECGGLMYLTRAIRGLDGERHEMVGLLPSEARMHERLRALGYVEVETRAETMLGPKGIRFRGHQFRYSELEPELPDPVVEQTYVLRRRRGGEESLEGYLKGNVLASYVHAHWASNPGVAAALVDTCARYRVGRPR